MERLLHEISAIPGVTGSCIFDRNQGILFRKLDIDLPRDITDNIGINFIRLLQMAAMNKLDVRTAQFRFDKYWLVGIPLYQGVILLAICDLQANCSLVAATAALLVDDMLSALEKPSEKLSESFTHGGAEPQQEDAIGDEGENVQQSFMEVEEALAAAIGPVAKMVMADSIYKWKQSGPPSAARFHELMDILAEEIEDSILIAEFRNQLQHLF